MTPRIAGAVRIRSSAAEFIAAFQRRVDAGLVSGRPHPRSKYRVIHAGPGELRIQAASWLTAINVGLNDVELRLPHPGEVHYQIQYWRWASYGFALCGLLGVIGLVLLLTTDARGYIARNVDSMIPGLSIDQNLTIAWGMVVFWGFVWPWLMIALHKRPLRGLVERVILEVDGAAAGR